MNIESHFSGKAFVKQFVLDSPLNEPEVLVSKLIAALQYWKCHGQEVKYEVKVCFGRVVIVLAEQEKFQISGCSKDQMFDLVNKVLLLEEIDLADPSSFVVMNAGRILNMDYDQLSGRKKDESWVSESYLLNVGVSELEKLRTDWFESMRDSFVYSRM